MPASLPTFSRALKLIRVAAFLMLLQAAFGIVMLVSALTADSFGDQRDALSWLEYALIVNGGATALMCYGTLRSIPELTRLRMATRGLLIAVAGFLLATLAIAWTYHVVTSFVDVALSVSRRASDLVARGEDLEALKYVGAFKNFAYGVALIAVIRTVQRSAAFNDQLALRDEAGSMSRALIVMVVGQLFYELTYANGALPVFGFIVALLIACYWIYCHVRLARFSFNAAYFMNEPHALPLAVVVMRSSEANDTSPAVKAPPPQRPPLDVVRQPTPIDTPRAANVSEPEPAGDGPRFLR